MYDAHTERIIPSQRVAHVHLFRHGEVETGTARVCRGQIDVALSSEGRRQSQAAASAFGAAFGAPDHVVCSDLSRCADLAALFGTPAEPTPLLREQNMGAWEGRSWEDLTRENPAGVTAYWNDYVNARPEGGESWSEAAERVVAWWGALGRPTGRIVVVTHIGPIRALLCHWLGLGAGEALRFAPAYASETRVIAADAGVVIETVGAVVTRR